MRLVLHNKSVQDPLPITRCLFTFSCTYEYERLGTDRAFAFPCTKNIAKSARPVCTEALILCTCIVRGILYRECTYFDL